MSGGQRNGERFKKDISSLYEKGPLSMPQMRDLLRGEGFEMAWIGANNAHRKYRIAIVVTATGNYYGLSLVGKRQLR
jgi:hypothetical protein